MAVLAYQFARSYLVDQRESLAVRQAVLNATVVREGLRARDPDVPALLQSLAGSGDNDPYLRSGDEWFSLTVSVNREAIPDDIVAATEEGRASRERVEIDGEPAVVVGIPLPAADAAYFEATPLRELDRTLSTLRWSLVAASSITTVLGAAVGAWASRRVLRPVRSFSAAAARLASGDLTTRLAAGRDRDLAPIADSFNEMAEALQQRIEREARFASDVTHELRTPLTALSAAVDVIERRSDERAQPALDVLRQQVRRFERLVLDLLEVSRFDAGASEVRREPVRPVEFVETAVRNLGYRNLVVEATAAAPSVAHLDKRRVERVIANLLENADRYGGGAVRVEVGGEGGILRVAVEDAGPGVPIEERDRVFERFHRSGAVASDGRGTGLGLALVAAHASLHGGRAWVEERVGGGARFVVEFASESP